MFSEKTIEEVGEFVELFFKLFVGAFFISFSIIGVWYIVSGYDISYYSVADFNTASLMEQGGFTFWRDGNEAVFITPNQEYYGKVVGDVWVGGYKYSGSEKDYCEVIYGGGIVRSCTLTEMSIIFSDLEEKVDYVKGL